MNRNHIYYLLILFLLLIGLNLSAQSKLSRVRIYGSATQLRSLFRQGFEFDHGYFDARQSFYTASVSAADLNRLRILGARVEVEIEDETAFFLQNNNPADFYKYDHQPVAGRVNFQATCDAQVNFITTPAAFTTGSMGGYYTLAEIITKVNNMVSAYPGLVRKDTIGYSIQNRPIIAVKISDNVTADENEPEILYTGLTHAREPNSMMNLIFFMQYLLENYAGNARIAELVNARELYFIPCLNPDGYEQNRITNPSGGGNQRKNMRNTGSTPQGVDLNRNFSWGWGADNVGSSPTPSSEVYRGTAPFSEPELQALRNFVNGRQFTVTHNFHSFGNTLVRPYDIEPAGGITPLETNILGTLGNLMIKHNCYVYGSSLETVGYTVNGASDDWFMAGDLNLRQKIYSYTPEVGTSFWPLSSQIIPIAKENLFTNLHLAYCGGTMAELQDESDVAVTALSGQFSFSLQRTGIGNQPVTVSLVPIENIQSAGAPAVIASMPAYLGISTGSVSYTLAPGIPAGQRIRFAWMVETDGVATYDTITKLYNPQVLLNDKMEGTLAPNWTTTGTWNMTGAQAKEGSQSLTDSPGGNYSASAASNPVYLATALNLSGATEAFLSFWVKYNAQNCQDRLQIELSTNGPGAGATYTAFCGKYTIRENRGSLGNTPAITGKKDVWVRELVDLKSIAGNSNVGLRFRLITNTGVTDDGFYIDDIRVIKGGGVVLSQDFLRFTAAPAQDGSVMLNWELGGAVAENRFEILKSVNGQTFFTIGRMNSSMAALQFRDGSPVKGLNYYRIKMTKPDGSVLYSTIEKLNQSRSVNSGQFYIYQSGSRVFVQLEHFADEELRFSFYNTNGQSIFISDLKAKSGMNSFSCDVSNWPGRIYFGKVENRQGKLIRKFSFLR